METGDLYRVPSMWHEGEEAFLRSLKDGEDDEEALVWASLERLPTYDRIRRGMLSDDEGKFSQVNIKKLGYQDRKNLLERLVKVAEDDNEKFLKKLRERIDRVGIDIPTIEVRYENLSVEAQVYVGNRGLPTILNAVLNVFENLANYLHILPSRKKPLSILHDVSGIIRPQRMTLLLGPPGAGKTTLLLALAGKLGSDLMVEGKVTYNGHEMNEFVPEKTAAYIGQQDVHIGELTVRETLAFSARCQGVGARYDLLTELSRREKAENIKPDPDIDVFMKVASTPGQQVDVVTDYTLKILGLDICADTMVGDQMRRGISGGQKKRVTTGEMLVGPSRAIFMDEISTGLDSSTTFQIVNSLRQSIHILGGTAVISLLQPAPETFELFDDIILLSDGLVVYQGPRRYVLQFFEGMGFKCPKRKGVADFLQEVTSRKDQEQYWACHYEPYRYVPAKEFAVAFNKFHVGQSIMNEISIPFDKEKSHPAALTTSNYGVSKKELFKSLLERELLLMKRNSFVYIFKASQQFIIVSVMMTLFLRTNMHHDSVIGGRIYMGALFFSVLRIMLSELSEIPMTILKLPVFFKQRDFHFYPSWAYAVPRLIIKSPIALVEAAIWVFMSYYVIGFDPNVGRLFKQFLLILLINQMASGLFRLIGALSRNMIIANTCGSFVLLMIMVLGGFIISKDELKEWWIWGYWISPLMYAQNAISTNEFLGKSWRHILPGSTETLGMQVLETRGIFQEAKWYWIGVGALAGYMFLFNSLFIIALRYLNPLGKAQPAMSEETLKEKNANIKGENLEPSTKCDTEASDSNQSKKGMVLPFVPLSITFSNIRYSVDMPKEMKAQRGGQEKLELLKGVSGSFRPGVLTALMGVSGAGKTTLMDVLAGRKTGGYIQGKITINGYPKKQETFARVSGYCEQTDIHSPHVTVYESLLYSAWLRLPPDVNSETRKMFIEEVMELVEVKSLRDAIVGLPGDNGLSTEQRKRLTIAVELVANPSIIFMDEPTSGLDARAAAIVMRTVRNTVNTGRTVVCTIHQPSIDIFEAFDELFLMKRGGEEIYVGPLGHNSCHMIKYFEEIQGISKIKDGYNPATWMLEVTTLAHEQIHGINFSDVYKRSKLFLENKKLIQELSTPSPGSKDLCFPTQYSQSFFAQCKACLWKQNLSYWRNPRYTAVRFLFTLIIALLFGTIFWDLGTKRSGFQDLFNAMGSMYAAVQFIGVQNASSVQPVVAVERAVFYREKAAGMYSAFPYTFGQVVIEIPYILVQTLIYGVVVYAMIGFEWTAAKFFWYMFFMYFTLLYFTLYGMMAVGLTRNQSIASVVSSAFYSMWNLFSGFLIPRTIIPLWWRWYYWICPVAWTLQGLLTSQFGDVHKKLESGEYVYEFVMKYFGFKHGFLRVVAAVVVAFSVLFASIFGISMKVLNFQRR